MGLLISLGENHNHVGIPFEDAYFAITEARISTEQGLQVIYAFSAYPDRETKIKSDNHTTVTSEEWGGNPCYPYFASNIYYYGCAVSAEEVFPEGIPVSIDGIKIGVYAHFKAYLDEHGVSYKDVFEDDEVAEN